MDIVLYCMVMGITLISTLALKLELNADDLDQDAQDEVCNDAQEHLEVRLKEIEEELRDLVHSGLSLTFHDANYEPNDALKAAAEHYKKVMGHE